jgi:hypothetical protein
MMMRVGRAAIVGGLALVGLVAPAVIGGPDRVDAQCRAVFGSRDNGICLDQPSGPGVNFSSPSFNISSTDEGGLGVSSSPLLPGQTIDIPVPLG